MRLVAAFLAAAFLLLSVPTASAQVFSPPSTERSSPAQAPNFSITDPQFFEQVRERAKACPVAMEVRHGNGMGQALRVLPGQPSPPSRPGQVLELTIHNRGWSGITSIDAIVHLQSSRARVMPLSSGPADEGEALPMHLDIAISTGNKVAVSQALTSSSAVSYVEISSVTFQVGSIWLASSDSTCRFRPDPLMLVVER